ncbi:hypothetical protein D3C73_988870 [compost metagenome]
MTGINDLPDTAVVRSDDRQTRCHGFHIDQTEGFVPLGGADETIGRLIQAVNLFVGDISEKRYRNAKPP